MCRSMTKYWQGCKPVPVYHFTILIQTKGLTQPPSNNLSLPQTHLATKHFKIINRICREFDLRLQPTVYSYFIFILAHRLFLFRQLTSSVTTLFILYKRWKIYNRYMYKSIWKNFLYKFRYNSKILNENVTTRIIT